MEEAVACQGVRGVADLEAWLRGRLHTVGVVDAAFAGAAHGSAGETDSWSRFDAEWAARNVSPAIRDASRTQGRGLLRAARACWPDPRVDTLAAALPRGAPWAVALGVVGAAAGCETLEVTTAAALGSVTGPAWAATRLLGSDPFAIAATLAALSAEIDQVAASACASAARGQSLADLPALSAPMLDLGAEYHAAWEVRLFAS
ncbi:MAG: urease accessory protein UreF [Acidimicrobiales bacterium]